MQCMDIVIFKGSFKDRYINNDTFIAFSIQDTIINIDESYWIIHATHPLNG